MAGRAKAGTFACLGAFLSTLVASVGRDEAETPPALGGGRGVLCRSSRGLGRRCRCWRCSAV